MSNSPVQTEFQEMATGHRQTPDRASISVLALFIRIFRLGLRVATHQEAAW